MIFTNLEANEKNLHGMFESSRLMATDVGDIYDVLVRDGNEKAIDVDNGVAIKVGDFTGNGLQERYATIAKVEDKIAVVGSPAEVKTAMTKAQEQPYNFYNKAGNDAKAYQIQDKGIHSDVFAVAEYQFTDESKDKIKVGNLVVVDGNGAWVADEKTNLETLKTTNGFIGKIHSFSIANYYRMVRIEVVQNIDIA